MDKQQKFRQTNAFALFDGLFFGIYCCVGLLGIVKGISSDTLSALGTMVTVSVPVLGCYFAHKFERQVRGDAPVSYRRAYVYSFLIYFYASLIMAVFAFVYFQWIDSGNFVQNYMTIYNSPEMQDALSETGMTQTIDAAVRQNGFESFEDALKSIGPFDIASSVLNVNFLAGLFLALPTALFGKTRSRNINFDNQ